GRARRGDGEVDDSRIADRHLAAHVLDHAAACGDEVAGPVDVATVGHGDHEARVAAERDHRRTKTTAALSPDVVDERERRHPPREVSHQRVGEDSVHGSHEPRNMHAANLARGRWPRHTGTRRLVRSVRAAAWQRAGYVTGLADRYPWITGTAGRRASLHNI